MAPLIHAPAWAEIAKLPPEDIREYILTGYKSGKEFKGEDFHLTWPVERYGRILDFGCGLGRNFSILKQKSHELVGLDIPEMIHACEQYGAAAGIKLTADFDQVTSEKFDLAAATLVLQHIEDPNVCNQILQKLARCCAFLYVCTRSWSGGDAKENVFERIRRSGGWEYHKGHISEEELCRLQYPNDTHTAVLYRSRDQKMREMSEQGPLTAFQPPTPEVRVGFITPSMVHPGGAEQWIKSLVEGWSTRIGRAGVCVTGPSRSWDMVRVIEAYCPVMFGMDALPILFDRSDVIVAWGLEDLPRLLRGYTGKVIVVSHGCCSWTRHVMSHAATVSDYLVAVSEVASKVFPEARDVEVIHNGIDPARVRPTFTRDVCRRSIGLAPQEKAIGYLGRLSFEKNPVAVAKAVQQLGDPYRAVIVGTGWQEELVLNEVRREVPNAICLPPRADVANVLNALDCFVLASPAEGMSLGMIEAWMARLPVVGTNVGALPELSAKFGQLAQVVALYPSREELAEKIVWAIDPCGKAITDRAYDMASTRLTADRMCRDYEELVLRVFNDKGPNIRERATMPKKVRVGVITPSLTKLGGAERWILSMIRMQHPQVEWKGVSVLGPDRDWDAVAEGQHHCSIMFGFHSAKQLAAQCDVIVSWGIDDLMETFIPEFYGKVKLVAVAQGSGNWTAKILQKIGQHADVCVGVSEASAAAFPVRPVTRVINNGFDPSRLTTFTTREEARAKIGLVPSDIAVGYIGRYSKEKNPLAAAHAVNRLGDNYRSVYMGDGPMRDEIREKVKQLDPRAIILEPSTEIADTLQSLDCFVLASPSEGFSLSLSEAWAMCVPVVATEVGGVPELVKKFGRIAWTISPEFAANDLTIRVREATAKTDECQEVIKRAQAMAYGYLTIEAMNNAYAELFISLMD